METTFRILNTNRKVCLQLLENYTLEQLNKIPDGFSNNLIWNIGHVLTTQQILVYKLSGMPTLLSDEMIDKYKNGSKPTANSSQEEISKIKALLFLTVEKTIEDFNAKRFLNYQEFTTKTTGFTIQNVMQAIEFNNYHEGIHHGIMLQIKKFL